MPIICSHMHSISRSHSWIALSCRGLALVSIWAAKMLRLACKRTLLCCNLFVVGKKCIKMTARMYFLSSAKFKFIKSWKYTELIREKKSAVNCSSFLCISSKQTNPAYQFILSLDILFFSFRAHSKLFIQNWDHNSFILLCVQKEQKWCTIFFTSILHYILIFANEKKNVQNMCVQCSIGLSHVWNCILEVGKKWQRF